MRTKKTTPQPYVAKYSATNEAYCRGHADAFGQAVREIVGVFTRYGRDIEQADMGEGVNKAWLLVVEQLTRYRLGMQHNVQREFMLRIKERDEARKARGAKP